MNPMHVAIAGTGVAGLETALALRSLAEERITLELVGPERDLVHRPLAVAEPFRMGEVRRFPLSAFAAAAGAELRHDAVVAVDADRKVLTLAGGDELEYDVLVAALGARQEDAIVGALTFGGPDATEALADLLDHAVGGSIERIVFAVPTGTAWPLPIYELALMTREFLSEHGTRGVSIVIATPEDRPLGLFGPDASDAVAELLSLREVELMTGVAARAWQNGALATADGPIEAGAVVALPALLGPSLPGLPHDRRGFVPTDEFGWVLGATDVYAVGDMTQFPVKQGGIATQQADAAASAIAADAGAPIHPTPFRPVLRGLLMTGLVPRYLRNEPGRGQSEVDTEPLWWPPAKIVGRHLAPFLAAHFGVPDAAPTGSGTVEIDVELDRHGRARTPV
jgi:sulfide:quinone oxidoreductase